MKNPYIFAFTETGETDRLFAEYDLEAMTYVCQTLYDKCFFDDDRASFEGIECGVQEAVIDNEPHGAVYGPFEFRRCQLNCLDGGEPLIDDPDFEVKKGAKVYEAALRVTMGCDMAYALEPHGYFTRRVDVPELRDYEWVERTLD